MLNKDKPEIQGVSCFNIWGKLETYNFYDIYF